MTLQIGDLALSLPAFMTISKEKLESFKQELEHKRTQLAADLLQSTANLIDDEVLYTDTVDQASAETDKDIIVKMKNRDRMTLFAVDEALRRLDLGVFGRCKSCGEEISEGRMKANIATVLCIDCQGEFEAERSGRVAIR